MNMNQETKQCQNCKNSFTIEPEDFDFYEKIKVPPPTFCQDCRMQRRFAFRNEWNLYKRKCDLCKKDIIAMYPVDVSFPVYCHECWFGDKWDAVAYGHDYDFSKPFFVQMKELFDAVPRLNLFNRNAVNSPFTNMVGESKNVYLSASVVEGSENVSYSKFVDKSFNIVDSISIFKGDYLYENINCDRNYSSSFAALSWNCMDCRFIFDCANCKNCVLSSNLRNKEYYIRNKPYSKEDYFKELGKMDFGSYESTEKYKKEFAEIRNKAIHKYADIIKEVNSTGDHMLNTKNAEHCFEVHDIEDSKYCFRVLFGKQLFDACYGGINSELVYEYITGGKSDYEVRFSIAALDAVRDVYYTDYCSSVSNCFGCSSLKSKEYCILNKQYSKKKYEELLPKIKKQMDEIPYTSQRANGNEQIVYRFGEFFPPELSPFAYNETLAQEHFPLIKEEAIERGYKWREPETKNYKVSLSALKLADDIKDVSDSIMSEIIGCAHAESGGCRHACTSAFRIIHEEFQFYRKMNLPAPRLCPGCRYGERLIQRNPLKLWKRKCGCPGGQVSNIGYQNTTEHFHGFGPCPNEFETSYAPERPEMIYCKQCYQAEVI